MGIAGGWYDVSCCIGRKTYSRRNFIPGDAFLAMQHKVGYQIAKRDVKEAVYLALPGWFMELALLLQNNNVQVSIEKSKNSAPPVLRYEIECLEERLKKRRKN